MAYIDKDKFRMHIIMYQNNLLKVKLTDKEKEKFIRILDEAPTADVVEVKHGYFIGTEFDGYADGYPVFYEWKCSECGCIFEDEEPTYNYCPQCGAKMDGKETKDGQS